MMTARSRVLVSTEAALRRENAELRSHLDEAEAIIAAIRSGSADAIALETPTGVSVFTLQGSEHPYRIMVETMNEGAVIVATDGLVLYCNERFAEMLETDLQEIIGHSFVANFDACDAATVASALASDSRPQSRFRASLHTATGRLRPVSLAVQRLPEDNPAASVVVLSDLTDLVNEHEARMSREREFQRQMQDLNHDLEYRVRRRTAERAAANEELDAFAYSVSHDLRAPLRAVDGFANILIEDYGTKLDEGGRHAIARVREGAQRMSALIDDMLSLSRATRNTMTLSKVDLSAMARSSVTSLREAQPARNVKVSIAPDIGALGDPGLLRAVIDNLLSNAWKFTANTPDALIEFYGETTDCEVVCHIRDNGAGFDMVYADKLFRPFQRLHDSSEYPGNGIGLATVKRIITRMGGKVSAQGALNQGANFTFSLPLSAE